MTTKKPLRITLPHGETDRTKQYSFPDPDLLFDAFMRVRRHHYNPHEPEPSRGDMACTLTLADAYLDLTMYELGQECCVAKLRDIWRARRARAEQEGE